MVKIKAEVHLCLGRVGLEIRVEDTATVEATAEGVSHQAITTAGAMSRRNLSSPALIFSTLETFRIFTVVKSSYKELTHA